MRRDCRLGGEGQEVLTAAFADRSPAGYQALCDIYESEKLAGALTGKFPEWCKTYALRASLGAQYGGGMIRRVIGFQGNTGVKLVTREDGTTHRPEPDSSTKDAELAAAVLSRDKEEERIRVREAAKAVQNSPPPCALSLQLEISFL